MNEKTVNDLRKWIDEFSGIEKYTTENIKDWIDNKPVTLNLNEISTMPVNLYGDKVIDATITEVLTNNITPESAAEVLEVEMKNNFSMDKAVKRYSLDNPEVTIPFGRIVPAPIIDLDDWTEIVPPVGQEDEYLKHLESNNWFDCEHKYDEESMKHYLRSLDAIPVHYKLNSLNFSKKNPITEAKEQVLKNFSNSDAKPTPLEVAREILPEFISIESGEGDSLVISVDDDNEYEDLAKSLTAVVQELSTHYPKADYIITEDNKSATVNFSKKDNKGVNMNISKEFIPTMDNYTQFGYTKKDDEIIVNKGSKKLVLEGADAIEWIDAYWSAKNTAMDDSDNFSIHSMDEWTKNQLKVLSPLTLVGLDDTKEYYLSGKMKVGDVIYLLGDPSTSPMVGKITKVGTKILTDDDDNEYPDIVVDLLDPYAIDDIDPESLEGAGIAEITKEVEKVLPVRLSNAELLKDNDIGYGFFPFGGFLITKHNYDKEYKDLVKEFTTYLKDKMNFSIRYPIRFRYKE